METGSFEKNTMLNQLAIYVHPKYKDCSIEDCDYRFDDLIIFNKKNVY